MAKGPSEDKQIDIGSHQATLPQRQAQESTSKSARINVRCTLRSHSLYNFLQFQRTSFKFSQGTVLLL